MAKEQKILIIGAGPTGLGAAYRLKEIGYQNFKVVERNDHVAGLSASFSRDGYTVDIGGHVLFSHYPYFDEVVAQALGGDYLEHQRECWIRMLERMIPYPFQNNIKFLPREMTLECLIGLLHAGQNPNAENFEQWIQHAFGSGIAKYFMNPYNFKVWAHPLTMMSKDWIAERVSVVDFEHVLENVILDRSETSWGPNNTFKFPLRGGTGQIFNRIVDGFRDSVELGKAVTSVNSQEKIVHFNDGRSESYDLLISTMPIDQLVQSSDLQGALGEHTKDLLYSSGYSVGVGIKRPLDDELRTKCWNYFPEDNCPFYRVTYLSNYSPNMVPDDQHFLLMAETSFSPHKEVPADHIIDDTINGLVATGFMKESDRELVDFKDLITIDYSYPIPSIHRDRALDVCLPALELNQIYSRGRFGVWRYETGNMDHSFMQGVEVVDYIIKGKPEITRLMH